MFSVFETNTSVPPFVRRFLPAPNRIWGPGARTPGAALGEAVMVELLPTARVAFSFSPGRGHERALATGAVLVRAVITVTHHQKGLYRRSRSRTGGLSDGLINPFVVFIRLLLN